MSDARSRSIVTTFAAAALAALTGTFALAGSGAPAGVHAPYRLASSPEAWDGDNHARPFATVTLAGADGEQLWALPGVVSSHRSDAGGTVAMVTRAHELWISRLPAAPRRVAGSYASARCAPDGRTVAAHVVGDDGDLMLRLLQGKGIALIDEASLEARMVLTGSDLYAPSFADDGRLFFGSGGPERLASLWILDLSSGLAGRITNLDPATFQPFPDEAPRLEGATVRYPSEGREVALPLPDATRFAPAPRFDPPARTVSADAPGGAGYGYVKLRVPVTAPCSWNGYNVGQYFDLDRRMGLRADWACGGLTYDGHRGTDLCQSCGNPVAAPAKGFVIEWYDGCPNIGFWGSSCGYGWGNHLAIVHDDGTVSLEAHGKAGTVVRAGNIACGATMMLSCSSGNSTGPHIHHENWISPNGRWDPSLAFDPYRGNCDAWDATKWKSQGAYGLLPGTSCN